MTRFKNHKVRYQAVPLVGHACIYIYTRKVLEVLLLHLPGCFDILHLEGVALHAQRCINAPLVV